MKPTDKISNTKKQIPNKFQFPIFKDVFTPFGY